MNNSEHIKTSHPTNKSKSLIPSKSKKRIVNKIKINYQTKNYQQAQQYLDHYMQLVKEPTANALWLGAVLARNLGNQTAAGSYTLMLQTRFPNSDAYKVLIHTPKLKTKHKSKQLYY